MITIRQFQPDDMFAVINIAYTSLPEHYNPSIFNLFYESFPRGFLVAEQHHKIIGFLVGIKTNEHTSKILMIATTRQHRRKKIGTLLLSHFLQEIRQHSINQIDLEVRTQNTQAIQFYQNHGFTIIESLPKFYQNQEDAFLMRKKVD